mgnify:CR=1 FL=1
MQRFPECFHLFFHFTINLINEIEDKVPWIAGADSLQEEEGTGGGENEGGEKGGRGGI